MYMMTCSQVIWLLIAWLRHHFLGWTSEPQNVTHIRNFISRQVNNREMMDEFASTWSTSEGTCIYFSAIDHLLAQYLRYIVDSLISLTRWLLTKTGSRVFFFPMAPSENGERAERLTNTLFGAKDGGRHRQERAVVLTSLRRTRRRCAWATVSEASWRSINS